MKVFLSHASEDKAVVDQVHLRLIKTYPEIRSWLDKYEILGGDDLIEKIHSGIKDADKFIIFLSPNSIDKPWVRTELRKALADEISGVKPEFIIPIKLGTIPSFPPFLESRFYIDIENKTEDEWLQDIYAAIHKKKKPLGEVTQNLRISAHIASDSPRAAILLFEALFWAEPISFIVATNSRVKQSTWQFPGLKGMYQLSVSELKTDKSYALAIQSHSIQPKKPFAIGLEFEDSGDPRDKILKIDKWDGSGGEVSFRVIEFK